MKPASWLIFSLLGLLAGCRPPPAGETPAPSPTQGVTPAENLLPTTPGTTWEYEVTTELPENAVELTDTVGQSRPLAGRRLRATRVTTLDGPARIPDRQAHRFTTRVNGELERVDYREISPAQIADVATDLLGPAPANASEPAVRQITFEQPLVLLRAPLAPGDSWQARFHVDGHPITRTFDVIGRESIHVPAGTFDTWRIRAIGSDRPGHSLESTTWFAPGIGFVKSRVIHTAAFGLLKIETEELTRGPVPGTMPAPQPSGP